ncbi:MAG: type I restriction enzyme HsdR N-terminal domain-containing protein [Salinivirgaceae bacterium]|nr:type I restriction enzyme HsdR N-terminal domain-containing protein [Salinivirgaceae bacterium]MDD4745878.1 type I restriction enzyme HsdR N-terminal domain-containing protein [Salinivirgaceae bacterium]MDY0278943.1 type I restriction enzyme HsdR N-terminal domain-containing protein [Salinivirgaceae bacterium]
MQSLNLPPIHPRIKKEGTRTYIFDPVRKTWLVLTPEEWVRQHIVNYLVVEKDFPASLIQIEKGHKYSGGIRRTDAVAYGKNGTPLMVIECKAVTVQITQQTIEQIAHYNIVIKAPLLLVTNGLIHLGYHVDFKKGEINALDSIPNYSEMGIYME